MPSPGYSDSVDHRNYEQQQNDAVADSLIMMQGVIDSPDVNNNNNNYSPPKQPYTYNENHIGNYEIANPWKPLKARPGDYGKQYHLDDVPDLDKNEVSSKKSEYGMNIVASDHIPMDRIVPDLRHSECKYWDYPERLPTASVVIVFHNEGFTTLLRTVHSVLLRSPQRFLREVLLVDDFSSKEPLKGLFICIRIFS